MPEPGRKVFPSYDLPRAEQAFREWMTQLTGLDGPELEEWLREVSREVIGNGNGYWSARHEPDEKTYLSDRELSVIRLVAFGFTNAEIAEALVISGETVKSHMNHCLKRTGCRSRTQLVVLAMATGQLMRAIK